MRILFVAFLLAALSGCALAQDMTADDLIAKHIEAIGGEENVRAAKTLFLKGTAFMQGTPLEMQMWVVLPNKSYSEVSMSNTVMFNSGCDGENAWLSQAGQTFYLEGDMKKASMRQGDFFPLLDYDKRGFKAAYIGEAMVKGDKAYKMALVYPEGDTTIYFFDAETFYTVKEESHGSSKALSNFKEVGDILWPMKVTMQSAQGQQMVTFDSIAVNVEVPDSFFVMPEDAQPMPGMHEPPADSGKPEKP